MSAHPEEEQASISVDFQEGRFHCKVCGMIYINTEFPNMPMPEKILRVESFKECHSHCRRA